MHEASALCCREFVGTVSAVLLSLFVLFYIIYFEKIRVFKAGQLCPLNILAWDDRKRQISLLFGFSEKI